jgi:hypothetical protein
MKKILISISVILLGAVIIYLVIPPTKTGLPLAQGPTRNELPNMFLMNADGSILEAKQLRGKVIIIIYFPDCDHCEREATEIRNNI